MFSSGWVVCASAVIQHQRGAVAAVVMSEAPVYLGLGCMILSYRLAKFPDLCSTVVSFYRGGSAVHTHLHIIFQYHFLCCSRQLSYLFKCIKQKDVPILLVNDLKCMFCCLYQIHHANSAEQTLLFVVRRLISDSYSYRGNLPTEPSVNQCHVCLSL